VSYELMDGHGSIIDGKRGTRRRGDKAVTGGQGVAVARLENHCNHRAADELEPFRVQSTISHCSSRFPTSAVQSSANCPPAGEGCSPIGLAKVQSAARP
jgi:hypothetical protein